MAVMLGVYDARMHPPRQLDPVSAAFVDAFPHAVAVLDHHGVIVHCNAAWRALGAAAEHEGGKASFTSLVAPCDDEGSEYLARLEAVTGLMAPKAAKLAGIARDALAGRPHEQGLDYLLQAPAGETLYQAILCPVGEENVLVQHAPVVADLQGSRLRDALLDLALALEDQRAAARRMKRRLGDIGRELHNPITPLRLELYLLAHGDLGATNERQRKALDIISRSVDRLVRGEQAFMRLADDSWAAPEPLDLGQLTAAAVEACQTLALQQGVRLIAQAPTVPIQVTASPDLLFDVVHRLVVRAVEATPAGATVGVHIEARGREGLVEVTDGGEGLTPAALRKAFEPWGGHAPADGDVVLHHVRRVVASLGGRVWAESEGNGQGVLMGLAFPLASEAGRSEA